MLTGIIILIAALILAVALAAIFRGKKRGAFDVDTRNPNEFKSHVNPEKDPTLTKNEFELNDRGEEGTKASSPANPNVYKSPVAPTDADNTRVSKNEFDLNDKGEEGTSASQPARPNEFDLKDEAEAPETNEPKRNTEEPPK